MQNSDYTIRLETAEDAAELTQFTQEVFGPGMKARAAYFLRETISHEPQLSFVAEQDGKLIGSVRLTKFIWGEQTALMLGPLGVLSPYKGKGVGRDLMEASVSAAKSDVQKGGPPIIMLVGDLAYYKPFGFKIIPQNRIELPRPADPARILACELSEDTLEQFSGPATRFKKSQT